MKQWRIPIAILLLAGLLFSAGPVLADDGLDVDIVIVGDDAEVDIDIEGDNATVFVDGWDISKPTIIQAANPGDGDIVDRWARDRIKDVILPEIEDLQYAVSITVDGMAKLIMVNGSQVRSLEAVIAIMDTRLTDGLLAQSAQIDALSGVDAQLRQALNAQHQWLSAQQVVIAGQQEQIEANHIAAMNYLDYRLDLQEHTNNLRLLGLFILSVVLAVGLGISILALRRRI